MVGQNRSNGSYVESKSENNSTTANDKYVKDEAAGDQKTKADPADTGESSSKTNNKSESDPIDKQAEDSESSNMQPGEDTESADMEEEESLEESEEEAVIETPMEETEPEEIPVNDDDIKFASNTLVVFSNNQWHFVYCAGAEVRISRNFDDKQNWVKSGARNIRIDGGNRLHCPEVDNGMASVTCECNNETENYHEKVKSNPAHFQDDVGAPASITTNEEIYIGPNNNMNSCLKVVKNKADGSLQIHSPCALEPWKTNQRCTQEGDYNNFLENYEDPAGSEKNVHQLDCNEFRLNL